MQKIISGGFRRVAGCFLAGVIAILPLAITVAVVTWVGSLVAGFLGPRTVLGRALASIGLTLASDPVVAYAIGAVVMLIAIFLVGVAVEAGAKGWLQRILDAIVRRIPLIGSVYGTSRQLVGLVEKKEGTDLAGMKAVFCSFGGQNGAGVLALLVSPEKFRINDMDYYIVIVPTSPVPVGGGLIFVPVDTVRPADVTVEGLMSIYVSMGVTAPQFLPRQPGAAT